MVASTGSRPTTSSTRRRSPTRARCSRGCRSFWFERTGDIVPNHLISATEACPTRSRGRAIASQKLEMLPVECVVRGYITGSGWKDYQATGAVCGIKLPDGPAGVRAAARADLHAGDEGRDRRPRRERRLRPGRRDRRRPELLERAARPLARALLHAAEHARERGVILADTKFEFGLDADGVLVLGDEVLTPDSSRFWPADGYEAGHGQPCFDKQYVRDWARSPAGTSRRRRPAIPEEIVEGTRARYIEAYEKITGEPFDAWLERTARVRARVLIRPKAGILDPAGRGRRARAAGARVRGRHATSTSAGWSSSTSRTQPARGDVRAAAGEPADRGLRDPSGAT